MKKGLFVTFEGPDGSGKTTISKLVFEKLNENGFDVIYTREPGGIDISEQIRDIILNPTNTKMDKRCEALLYAASRRQHLIEKILPALENNQIVISDRFVDSSIAYQGIGREIGIKEVMNINEFAIESHYPDMTIFLDIKAEVGLERIKDRKFRDRLDQEDLKFHNKVYIGYKEVLEMFKDRMIKLDANKEVKEVVEDAYNEILKRINSV